MTNWDDSVGGSAFPCEGGDSSGLYPDPGMSLRDWFAGKALSGFCGNSAIFAANDMNGWTIVNASYRQLADDAYSLADAMLAARKIGE